MSAESPLGTTAIATPQSRAIRVLHVAAGLAPRQGGVAANVLGIARCARTVGIDNVVFALDTHEPAAARRHTRVTLKELTPTIQDLDVELFRARPPYRFMYSPELRSALAAEMPSFDVVHIHSLFLYPQLVAFRIAQRLGKPYLVTIHGCLDPALRGRSRIAKAIADRLWQRRMLDGAAVLHFTTETERDLAADLGYRAPSIVVPNGIDWDSFQVGNGGAAGGACVLYLGRVSHKKGIDVLIRALPLLRRDVPSARLVVAGPDDEGLTPNLIALARDLDVSDHVEFVGHLGPDERLRALAAADVWALPSRTENFGTTVVEAMAAGVPTVISPEVNLSDGVARAGAGVVCHREPEAFASALSAILSNPNEQARLRRAGMEFARAYDWGALARRFRAMYELVQGESA
jgi:glycosyltransferase involved in cell wall biosynthesis